MSPWRHLAASASLVAVLGFGVSVGIGAVGCGGGAESGAGGQDGVVGLEEPACVEVRFGRAPADQGQDPPSTEVTPGDVPLPVCPEDERRP